MKCRKQFKNIVDYEVEWEQKIQVPLGNKTESSHKEKKSQQTLLHG